MRLISIFFILLATVTAHSWECLDGYSAEDDFSIHLELSTDILFGRVIGGKYDQSADESSNISFEFDIHKTFKGNLSQTITLYAGLESYFGNIAVGQNYVFFLYGGKEIDFCGFSVELGVFTNNMQDFRGLAEHELFGHSAHLSAILEYYAQKP